MPLSKNDKMLLEAFKSMLSSGDGIGLNSHKSELDEAGRVERGIEHLHGQIDEMFALKSSDLVHYTGIRAAFAKVHSYKYIEDPTFNNAMAKEMTAQGIPTPERNKALEIVKEIIEELKKENEDWSESDASFHPDLDDVTSIPGREE